MFKRAWSDRDRGWGCCLVFVGFSFSEFFDEVDGDDDDADGGEDADVEAEVVDGEGCLDVESVGEDSVGAADHG